MADTTHMHAKLGLGDIQKWKEKSISEIVFLYIFHQIIPHPCMHKNYILMCLGS